MYSNSNYIDPTTLSNVERSQRFGSGVYPVYSTNNRPVQNNILNASVSTTPRNINHYQQVNPVSRDAIANNIRNIVTTPPEGEERASANTQSSAAYKLNLEKIFSNLNTQDPFQAFILEPRESSAEDAIFDALACKNLPDSVKNKVLDWPSVQARNLLGIISQDVLPEDRARLKKCFAILEKVQYDSEKECGVGKDISFLLHKYGKPALYRHVEAYTECCRKVWHYYNPGHETHPQDNEIFTSDAEHCYKVLFKFINELTLPNQIWGEIVVNGIYFKNSCGALALTIKIDPNIQIPAESLTETFESIYLNKMGNVANDTSDYTIENVDVSNTKSIWERIANALCCGA